MTMVPMYKKCPRCRRRYSWNPDAGQMWCPYCGLIGKPGLDDNPWKKIKDILKGKRK